MDKRRFMSKDEELKLNSLPRLTGEVARSAGEGVNGTLPRPLGEVARSAGEGANSPKTHEAKNSLTAISGSRKAQPRISPSPVMGKI